MAKNVSRGQTSLKKTVQVSKDEDKRRYESNSNPVRSDSIKWQQTSSSSSSVKISEEVEERKRNLPNDRKVEETEDEEKAKFYSRQAAARSRSTDVTTFKKEIFTEERRHTDCGDIRISSRFPSLIHFFSIVNIFLIYIYICVSYVFFSFSISIFYMYVNILYLIKVID